MKDSEARQAARQVVSADLVEDGGNYSVRSLLFLPLSMKVLRTL